MWCSAVLRQFHPHLVSDVGWDLAAVQQPGLQGPVEPLHSAVAAGPLKRSTMVLDTSLTEVVLEFTAHEMLSVVGFNFLAVSLSREDAKQES